MQKIHHAKKSLGQNFLKSESALRKIIEEGEIKSSDIVLEIGPGKGVLTKKLLENAGRVVAIEKDKNLVEFLQEKFAEEIKNEKLILLNEDILQIEIQKILQDVVLRTLGRSVDEDSRKFLAENFCGEQNNILQNFSTPFNYKIIANIPYNITGAILKKFLQGDLLTSLDKAQDKPLKARNQPSMMVLMVQNEVARRIVARDGKESILSISVKAYGTPKLAMKVPARYFSPAPKVDSAIISIKNISRKLFTSPQPSPYKGEGGYVDEEKFWEIIHAGFAHKRKKLSNNLKKYIDKTHKTGEKDYKNMRAENLTLDDWLLLTKN